jgi:Protein of unknown function (DUF2950)
LGIIDPDSEIIGYVRKLLSDEGQHNGLYWKAADGEVQSPIGPLVASAVADDDGERQAGSSAPYRGYSFRILAGAKEGENLGKTWAKNRCRIGSKSGIEGCKSRRINNRLD